MTGFAGRDAVIVGAVRTPVGKGKANGALHGVLPADLLAHSLRELVQRTGVDPVLIDDVIAGAVTEVGDQAVNIARNALLGAGFPESVPGTTVDRQCGSSQQAISFAAQGVLAALTTSWSPRASSPCPGYRWAPRCCPAAIRSDSTWRHATRMALSHKGSAPS